MSHRETSCIKNEEDLVIRWLDLLLKLRLAVRAGDADSAPAFWDSYSLAAIFAPKQAVFFSMDPFLLLKAKGTQDFSGKPYKGLIFIAALIDFF